MVKTYQRVVIKPSDPFQSGLIWDMLAIVCLAAALTIAGFAVYEFKFMPRPDVRLDGPNISGQGEEIVVPAVEWQPFDAYAQAFAIRDIFKTDAEKILEANQTPVTEIAANTAWSQGYQLSGVIVDQEPRAVIRVFNPPGTQVLSLGDKLGGAELIKIEDSQVLFQLQNQTISLKFEKNDQK